MKPPADDLDARAPVWEAMSELFLDTDTTRLHATVAQVLADSPYSVEELRDILVEEINPVLWSNLYCVAGIWQGFDQDGLRDEILRQQTRSRWRRRLLPQPVLRDDWCAIVPLVGALRESVERSTVSALTDDSI
ncbi:hypothetical protein [Tahibacter sp.]|uniref:DUF7079 family protein n=1 Tax=Tahibacter sp. TaxID=2056211 RepID=UPI0028C45E76|nr:hypothetical protein [Tahibacter sp.]